MFFIKVSPLLEFNDVFHFGPQSYTFFTKKAIGMCKNLLKIE